MKDILVSSVFFGVMVSILTYEAGVFLKKKTGLAICNPLLISVVLVMLILGAFHIDYEDYKQGASLLSYLLTPATVCLAIPLYEQIQRLKENWQAILAGIFSGVLTSLITICVLSMIFHLNHEIYATLLPKSITTAIGMGVSEEMGGIVTITVAVIIITGIFGNVIGEFVFKLFRIQEPIARGVALGTSAHAIGTSKALELGELEGAMSGLSIAVAGLLTVVLAPLFGIFI